MDTAYKNKSYIWAIITVMFLWALCYPLIVLGLDNAPHITFAALRSLLAGLTLLAIAIVLGRKQPKELAIWIMLIWIGIGATTLGFYGMFHASEFVSPGLATVITNIQPMLTAVLAALILNERITTNVKIGLILGFVGVLFIASTSYLDSSDISLNTQGLLYLLLAVVGIAVSNILIKKIVGKVDALIAMGWQLIFGSIFLWIVALSTENIFEINWNTNFIISLFGLAILGTALAFWLWFQVLEKVELSYANSYSFLVPVFGIVMGILFYDEKIGLLTGIGISIIIIGLVLVNSADLLKYLIPKKHKMKLKSKGISDE
jgi:drug/metabolite transporter (DMT)-like permease